MVASRLDTWRKHLNLLEFQMMIMVMTVVMTVAMTVAMVVLILTH